MKSILIFSLMILIQTTSANKHSQDNKPRRITLSKPSNIDHSCPMGSVDLYEGFIFPCPIPEGIQPCTCCHSSLELTLSCPTETRDLNLQEVLQEYFPVRYFKDLKLHYTYNIKHLDQTHPITFKRIDIMYSSLQSVKYDFVKSSVHHLKEVYIANTQLRDFPLSELKDFKLLDSLTIESAALKTMPPLVGRKLNYFNLKYNAISSISKDSFKDVPRLRYLDMSGNSITILPTNSVPIRSGMDFVTFSSNPISHIDPGAFYDGSKDLASAGLRKLELYHTGLISLGERSVPLTQLTEYIGLWNNAMSSISPGAFFILSEPEPDSVTIDLKRNHLATIDEAVFGPIMDYIETLDLIDNPLDCVGFCGVAWIVRNSTLMDKIREDTTCAEGTDFNDLQPEDFSQCP